MTATFPAAPFLTFLRTRWRGEVALGRLFWWDTLAVATLANAGVAMAAMILLSKGLADGGLWLLLHLILLPYNLFLVISVWRHGQCRNALRLATLGWLGLTLVA